MKVTNWTVSGTDVVGKIQNVGIVLHRAPSVGTLLTERDNAEIARLIAAAPVMRETLETLHNWLVCAPIATPEDMAESFEGMEKLIALALDIAK